ncbi:MAG: transporter suffix domain-containing protein [Tangfeifania sp.]
MKKKNWQIKLGVFLMVFSGVFFAATFVIPMLDLPTKTKIIASTTSLVLMEIVFWSGGLLVGKELFTRYKKQMNPKNWFKKKTIKTEKTPIDT